MYKRYGGLHVLGVLGAGNMWRDICVGHSLL